MLNLNYQPEMLFDATGMTQDEWEAARKLVIGIGGSEVAAILGDSKFKTNLDIFREKLGAVREIFDSVTQFMFDMGHKMEEMVARAFVIRHPEWELVEDLRMCRHPFYPFMTGNIDYLLRHKETGELAILECKYVTPDSAYMWYKEAPEYYIWQTRHYMSIWNINRAFVAALWGNNPFEHGTDHQVIRDLDIEEKLIAEEAAFWDCVQTKTPPVLRCKKTAALKKFLETNTPSNSQKTEIVLGDEYAAIAARYAVLEERHSNAYAQEQRAKAAVEEAKAQLLLGLGEHSEGVVVCDDGTRYRITATPKNTSVVDMAKLQAEFPQVYDAIVSPSVTLDALKKASQPAYKACVSSQPHATNRTFKVREESPR